MIEATMYLQGIGFDRGGVGPETEPHGLSGSRRFSSES